MKGKIIVIEGTDCSGKETQSKKLEDYLKKSKSYFMVNKENPEVIFDDVKYWDSRW